MAHAGVPGRRPLFLRPALGALVDADGPALRVRDERRAETRFPLDRISRIVASARVSWSAEALRACLERAIPIVIVNAHGSPLGSVLPAHVRASPLAEALGELLDWPDWRDIYNCWLRAARMRVLADWRCARNADGAAPDARAYQDLIKRYVYPVETAAAKPAMTGLWRGALYALAAEIAQRWGIPAVIWGSEGDAIALRRDLADLMELRLRLEISEQVEGSLKGEAMMLLVLHTQTKKLESAASRAIRSLARRLNEVLSGCR
ncbi:MAG: CRISPR-associated endonuclease Cas1 [Pseudomonadota bacterium]